MAERPASNRQLWVLNTNGRLLLLPVGQETTPLTSPQADEAIKQGIAATQGSSPEPITAADAG